MAITNARTKIISGLRYLGLLPLAKSVYRFLAPYLPTPAPRPKGPLASQLLMQEVIKQLEDPDQSKSIIQLPKP